MGVLKKHVLIRRYVVVFPSVFSCSGLRLLLRKAEKDTSKLSVLRPKVTRIEVDVAEAAKHAARCECLSRRCAVFRRWDLFHKSS